MERGKEKFVLVAFHCSGGHGDTFSVLGVFDELSFVMAKISDLQLRDGRFRMVSIDHGFFVYAIDLDQPYLFPERASENCICCVRYQSGRHPEWKEEWFSLRYYSDMLKAGLIQRGLFVSR